MGIKIPWQVWACAGVLLALIGWGEFRHWQGEQKVQREWDASIERGKGIVAELKTKQGAISEKIVYRYVDRVKTIYVKGDTIEKLIPQYIPVNTPDLPPGFRVLHDAAATNTIPGDSSGIGAKPVPVDDLARTLNFNYALCHAERAKLDSLWAWAQEQRKVYLEKCKELGVVCN